MTTETIWVTTKGNVKKDDIIGCAYDKSNAEALFEKKDNHAYCTRVEDSRLDHFDGNNLIGCDCKYMSPKLKAVVVMIHALYELDGCDCGGICHIVTDEDNYDDDSIQCILEECKKPENIDCIELELAEAICKALLKLSMQERALIFSGFYTNCLCDMNFKCKECSIEKGEIA